MSWYCRLIRDSVICEGKRMTQKTEMKETMDGQRERKELSTLPLVLYPNPSVLTHTYTHSLTPNQQVLPHPSPLTPHPTLISSLLTHLSPHPSPLTPYFLSPHFLSPLSPYYHTSPLPLHPSPPPSSLPTPPTFRLFGCSLSSSTCFFLSSLSTFLL